MNEMWTSDCTSVFYCEGDTHTYLKCAGVGDIDVKALTIEVCAHCGLPAPFNRFIVCPGCGSYDRVDVASGVLSATMILSGPLPYAQALLNISNGITIEILHQCRGLPRDKYHPELVIMRLLRCERLSIIITGPVICNIEDTETICVEIELKGILEIRKDDGDMS